MEAQTILAKLNGAKKQIETLFSALKPEGMAETDWKKSPDFKELEALSATAKALAGNSRFQVGKGKVQHANLISQLRAIWEDSYIVSEAEFKATYEGHKQRQRMDESSAEGLLVAAGPVVENTTTNEHDHTIKNNDGTESVVKKVAKMFTQTIEIKLDGSDIPLTVTHIGFDQETLSQVGWRLQPFVPATQQQRVKLMYESRLVPIRDGAVIKHYKWIGEQVRIISRIGASNLTALPTAQGEQQAAPTGVTSSSFEEME